MDNIEFEVLEDGTITTRIGGAVSDANHLSADKLLRQIETLAGGEVSREKIAKGHSHIHQGNHTHTKAGA